MSGTTVNHLIGLLGRRWRQRRMAMFIDRFGPTPDTRILDVGGTVAFWSSAEIRSQIVVLNTAVLATGEGSGNITYRQGDGTALGFQDGEFDIVFSNSVIEHLGTLQSQRQMAREIRRVGRAYWVQTPARGFPFDAHLLALFIHWLPRRMHRYLAPVTPYALLSGASGAQARETVDELRFVSIREMRCLFPDAVLWRETVLGITKSFVAYRRL